MSAKELEGEREGEIEGGGREIEGGGERRRERERGREKKKERKRGREKGGKREGRKDIHRRGEKGKKGCKTVVCKKRFNRLNQ